jgi:hypothetical protein
MNYTFQVTEQEASYILLALQELPAKIANPLTKKLQDQAREQKVSSDQQE